MRIKIIKGNQVATGGYRQGSGRPVGSSYGTTLAGKEFAARLYRLQQSGRMGRTSDTLMHALGDAEYWLRVISELEKAKEWGMLVDVLKFHQQMRDGRPAQQINITSATVQFTPEQIARARAVVRELTGTPVPTDRPSGPLMLGQGQGEKNDG